MSAARTDFAPGENSSAAAMLAAARHDTSL
jgi:hypothetical protein